MNRILKYLLVSESMWMLAVGFFGPIYAIFVTGIDGTILDAGGAYAAFSLVAGFLVFFISRWEDHIRHKEKLVIIGHLVGAAGILGYMFVSNTMHLFIVQAVLGISQAIGSPAFEGIYSRNLDRGKFVSEWGMYDSIGYAVAGVSAGVGGFIAFTFGFPTLFFIMFVLAIMSTVVSVKLYYLNKV